MGNIPRLIFIGLLAPLLAHLVGAVFLLAPLLLLTAPVSYPLMCLSTFALLVPLHLHFVRMQTVAGRQLLPVFVCGMGGGMVVYLLLFSPNVSRGAFDVKLALSYLGLGAIAGCCCWLLYNWGPFRVARVAVTTR